MCEDHFDERKSPLFTKRVKCCEAGGSGIFWCNIRRTTIVWPGAVWHNVICGVLLNFCISVIAFMSMWRSCYRVTDFYIFHFYCFHETLSSTNVLYQSHQHFWIEDLWTNDFVYPEVWHLTLWPNIGHYMHYDASTGCDYYSNIKTVVKSSALVIHKIPEEGVWNSVVVKMYTWRYG